MENKRRKMENNDETNKMNLLLQNQDELHRLIYQIGCICETSNTMIGVIHSKIEMLENKTHTLHNKITFLENTIGKLSNSFLKELHQKNETIKSLEELNINIQKDYEQKINILENSNNSSSIPSYYN